MARNWLSSGGTAVQEKIFKKYNLAAKPEKNICIFAVMLFNTETYLDSIDYPTVSFTVRYILCYGHNTVLYNLKQNMSRGLEFPLICVLYELNIS